MKKLLSIITIFFCFSFAFAIDFHVTVLDSEIEIPLEGVTLTLSNKSGEQWETDFNGECVVSLEDYSSAVVLQAYLPGYAIKKVRLSEEQTEVVIMLSIEEIMEGKELVVEKEAYQTADDESGISIALTKDQIQTTALIGAFPDIMTTVKTLPGVGYAGSFSQQPSIRGSYPYETACVLDGMYVLQPYHWSGTISIFDPLMVESVKLSHGIFSAQYGHSTAALLDINSINPIGDAIKINTSISSMQTDMFAQIPVSDKLGFLGGFRVTYMNTVSWLYDNLGITRKLTRGEIQKISDYVVMPYLYDFYLKGFYTPTPSLSFRANAFLGMEGLGAKLAKETEEDQRNVPPEEKRNFYDAFYFNSYNDTHAKWDNIFGFGSLDLRWLPTDSLQFVGSGSYNIYNNSITAWWDAKSEEETSAKYFNWFTERDELLNFYSEHKEFVDFENSYYVELFQGKAAANYQINNSHLISLGFEEMFQRKTSVHRFKMNSSSDYYEWWNFEARPETNPDYWELNPKDRINEGNDIYNTVGYSFWEFGNDTSLIKGELGLRLEHYYLDRAESNNPLIQNPKAVSTNPYINPRFSIQCTPLRNAGSIDKLTFSAGSGVFTKMEDSTMDLGSVYSLDKKNLKPDRNVFALLGSEINFMENLSFQIEGYYKYYTNRFYTVATGEEGESDDDEFLSILMDAVGINLSSPKKYAAYSDGIGHVAGFDCMLQKKGGRYFDGYLCYSYVFARYKNPSGYVKDIVEKNEAGDPIGIWYFPYFHRYHTLSAVINYRPTSHSTWTVTAGVASGSPKNFYDEVTGKEIYSDKLRFDPVYPVNLRYAYSNYASASKVKWELYIGIENLFGLFNKSSLVGAMIADKEIDLSNVANFDTGIPAISVGYRLSF